MTTWLLWFEPSPALPPRERACILGRIEEGRSEDCLDKLSDTIHPFNRETQKQENYSPPQLLWLWSVSALQVLVGIMISRDLNLYFISFFLLRAIESKNSLEWGIKSQAGTSREEPTVILKLYWIPSSTQMENLENCHYSMQAGY